MSGFDKRYHPPGTAPGTLQAATPRGVMRIHLVDYQAGRLDEVEEPSIEDCLPWLQRDSITWIHLQGHPDAALLQRLGDEFGLHPLALEDVHNTGQRPKVELYEQHHFIVAALAGEEGGEVALRQVSLFCSERYIVSIVEGDEDPFEEVRKRMRGSGGRFLRKSADYLLYALLDVVIDHGFPLLERFGEHIEEIEELLLDSPGREVINRIHHMRRELLHLRRYLWAQREVPGLLLRGEGELLQEENRPYFRDCLDHATQILDITESYREMVSSLLDLYLSSQSNRLNESMRLLTIIATLFIPPTFIVGLYGMNFDPEISPWNMPELGWYLGYPFAWGLILLLVGAMLWLFHRRGWF